MKLKFTKYFSYFQTTDGKTLLVRQTTKADWVITYGDMHYIYPVWTLEEAKARFLKQHNLTEEK